MAAWGRLRALPRPVGAWCWGKGDEEEKGPCAGDLRRLLGVGCCTGWFASVVLQTMNLSNRDNTAAATVLALALPGRR